MVRLCTDYTYFHIGIAIGELEGLVATLHLGFWAIEFVIINRSRIKWRNKKIAISAPLC